MGNIGTVFRFGWHYLRRYWTRLVAGVLLGILFGLTNASFVWATKVMIGRMAPVGAFDPAKAAAPSAPASAGEPDALTVGKSTSGFTTKLKAKAEKVTDQAVDPWLPRFGRAIDWRQFLGGLLF